MTTIKVNFKDDSNANKVIAWLRSNGIDVEILNELPQLNNESTPKNTTKNTTKTTTTKVVRSNNDEKFPVIPDMKYIGAICFSDSHMAVRHWGNDDVNSRQKRRAQIKIYDANAKWDKSLGAYVFKTQKEYNNFKKEWPKMWKEIESK